MPELPCEVIGLDWRVNLAEAWASIGARSAWSCRRCRPMEAVGEPPEWLRGLLEAVEREPSRRWRDEDLRDQGLKTPGEIAAAILPDHDVERAQAVAASIQTALKSTAFLQGSFSWAEGPIYWREPLTASVGLAVSPVHLSREGNIDLKKSLLLRAADQAMYEAKAAGKNQVRVAETEERG